LKFVFVFQVTNKSQYLESKSSGTSETWNKGRKETTDNSSAFSTDGNSEKGNISVACPLESRYHYRVVSRMCRNFQDVSVVWYKRIVNCSMDFCEMLCECLKIFIQFGWFITWKKFYILNVKNRFMQLLQKWIIMQNKLSILDRDVLPLVSLQVNGHQ
jgi:hypothetical protein